VAKANGLELDVVETDTANPSAEYLKYNKLGKVPTLVGSDGYVLHECIAIAIYRMSRPSSFATFKPPLA
jgi:elongation factor 1-gamma